ncbi:cupin [Streptomyces sp. NPDC059402]|uniref:cupin n=1 Tax=Streptomyces sp. NPDC059402 TaxID=3346822 RepID=UPI003690AD68
MQTLTTSGFQETPLAPDTVARFTPGTNPPPRQRRGPGRGLEITVVMQNRGLPEAGDAVLTPPRDLLADPGTYADAIRVPADGTETEQAQAVRTRRDLATRRFLELREATENGDPEPPTAFQRAAADLVRPRPDAWERQWREGVHGAAEATRAQLDALRGKDDAHPTAARVFATGPAASGRFGTCGRPAVRPGVWPPVM